MEMLLLAITLLFLIFFNIYLARLSRRLYLQKYGQHLVFETPESHRELSKSKKQTIIIPLFIGILSGFISIGLLIGLSLLLPAPLLYEKLFTYPFLYGFIVTSQILLTGRYLSSIIVFKHAIKYPEDISGTTTFKYRFIRKLHLSMIISSTLPFLILAILYPTDFMIGAAIGILTGAIGELINIIRVPVY